MRSRVPTCLVAVALAVMALPWPPLAAQSFAAWGLPVVVGCSAAAWLGVLLLEHERNRRDRATTALCLSAAGVVALAGLGITDASARLLFCALLSCVVAWRAGVGAALVVALPGLLAGGLWQQQAGTAVQGAVGVVAAMALLAAGIGARRRRQGAPAVESLGVSRAALLRRTAIAGRESLWTKEYADE